MLEIIRDYAPVANLVIIPAFVWLIRVEKRIMRMEVLFTLLAAQCRILAGSKTEGGC